MNVCTRSAFLTPLIAPGPPTTGMKRAGFCKLRYDDLQKLSDKLLDVTSALDVAKQKFASFMVEPPSETLATF
ncbi:MAG: hypothetical protein M3495_04260 [Pseudomonadota bacterium]|nr:hypothetical protein [Gammaproteobacteria bacterium]MDQ3580866.1 hypothetical protein [Pseudomonadota bacterium]